MKQEVFEKTILVMMLIFLVFSFGFVVGELTELSGWLTGYVRYDYAEVYECMSAKIDLARLEAAK